MGEQLLDFDGKILATIANYIPLSLTLGSVVFHITGLLIILSRNH